MGRPQGITQFDKVTQVAAIRDGFVGQTPHRFLQNYSGNAGAEFALVLPILMLLLFGGIEIGRALHDFHVVNQTVRDAGRYLSRVPYTCSGAGIGSCTTCQSSGECGVCDFVDANGNTTGDYITNAKALAMTGDTSGGSNLLAAWTDPSSITIEMCSIDNSGGAFGGFYQDALAVPHVKVTAQVPFTFLFGELIAPDTTIDITLSHNIVAVGQ